jgi:hypothetical protein
MLRITVIDKPDGLTFQLEGKLAGAWVEELELCRRHSLSGRPSAAERFDLTGVTGVDDAGKHFLSERHAEGAQFVACDCLMRAIVAEIKRNSVSQRRGHS